MHKLKIIMALCFVAQEAFSEIKEINNIQEIENFIDTDSLVVFDIDNTIIEPYNFIGSDQWYYYLVDKFNKTDLLSSYESHKKAEEIWNKSQYIIKCKTVEPLTPSFLMRLQHMSKNIMALTARSFDISDITKKQLLLNKIDFSAHSPYKNYINFNINNQAHYSEGILFQGEGNNKGEVLVEFLKHIKEKPKKIIFVDDKKKNVEAVHKALENFKEITHIEFRYAHADKHVQDFIDNTELFNGQWQTFAEEKYQKALSTMK